jgi:hypothetical protein
MYCCVWWWVLLPYLFWEMSRRLVKLLEVSVRASPQLLLMWNSKQGEDQHWMWAAWSTILAVQVGKKQKKEETGQYIQTLFFLSEFVYCCCHHSWRSDWSSFSFPKWTHGSHSPGKTLSLGLGCVIGPPCPEDFQLLWLSSYSGSPAYRWPFWDYPASACVNQYK